MRHFFTGDTHFYHRKICLYAGRPFATDQEHTAALITNWNSVVQPEDTVWFVGDFSFGAPEKCAKLIDRLNGTINFLWGNHDQALTKAFKRGYLVQLLKPLNFLGDYHRVNINDQDIILCYYAMRVWDKSHHDSWMLYGHSHGSLPDDPHALSIDVGVDCNNVYPFSFEQVKKRMDKKLWKPVDQRSI